MGKASSIVLAIVGVTVLLVGTQLAGATTEIAPGCWDTKFYEILGLPPERVIEVKEYIDDNKVGLNLPEWSDNDTIICGIAEELVKMEIAESTVYEDEDLDTNLKLLIIKQSGEAVTRFLENPDQYLNQ